jgi:histone demethylase JARID1
MPQRSPNVAAGRAPQDHRSDPEPGTRANLNYLDQLAKFHKQQGTNLNRFPSVDKRPLDLYKLKKAVEVRGGFEQVCKLKKWAEIGRDLGYSGKIMSSLSTSLKNSYQRWLQPYEEYLRVAKPGVQQQREFEQGGPYTPSPNHSPMNKRPVSSTPSNIRQDSPAVRASGILNASIETDGTPDRPTPPSAEPAPARPAASSGFTAVNKPGGFTPVNRSPSFVAVNSAPQVKHETENGTPTPKAIAAHPRSDSVDPKQTGISSTPTSSTPISTTPAANGHGAHPLKRAISHDSLSGSPQVESGDADNSGRRSKRLRKGMYLPQSSSG